MNRLAICKPELEKEGGVISTVLLHAKSSVKIEL